jgi:glutamate:GABA antiporter
MATPTLEPTTISVPTTGRSRVMGLRDVTLFTIAAMLVIDQLTASASIGPSVVGWWLLTFAVFLVPSAFITAELGTAYPDQGGLYVWIKRAFGPAWAARTTYWYWVNVALWMPAVFLLFAGTFAELFAPDLGKWGQSGIALALTWLVVWIGMQKLDVGKWVNNLGALSKVIVIAAIAGGGIYVAATQGPANDLSARSMLVPDFHAAKFFLPVLVFQLLGFELVSSMADEIERPRRAIPRAIALAGGALGVLYLAGTIGILQAMPIGELGLVAGIVDTLKAIFGTTGAGAVAVYVVGVAALYAFFTNMTAWSMGANRAAAEAALGGELPAAFGHEHPVRRTPVTAFVLTGLVSSAVLLGTTAVLDDQDSLYFAIFAASSVVFLLPYLFVFPSFLILRRRDAATPRPYRAPGGRVGAMTWTVLTTGSILVSVGLFLWTPGEPVDWAYSGSLLVIVGVTLVVGELLRLGARRAQRSPVDVTTEGR